MTGVQTCALPILIDGGTIFASLKTGGLDCHSLARPQGAGASGVTINSHIESGRRGTGGDGLILDYRFCPAGRRRLILQ